MQTTIAIVGDFKPTNPSHLATQAAIGHAAAEGGSTVESNWIGTQEVAAPGGLDRLARVRGLWIAPASPYQSMDGALQAIRLARERKIALLGTCGGFQHIIVEYARNVWGIPDAEHAETAPDAARPVISRLACSLVGTLGTVQLKAGSRVARAYGQTQTQEQYLCNFGLNPEYMERLRASDLRIVGTDQNAAVRAVELADHPFFVGTLFLPQLRSTEAAPHPVILAFVRACS
jgi:CTP synthase (UTP-ammonia lyase)